MPQSPRIFSSLPTLEPGDEYPQTEWLPIFNRRTPYDEQAIVQSVTGLYEILIKLSYIPADAIAFPPPEGYPMSKQIAERLHLDPAVISLMNKLPYPKDMQTSLGLNIFRSSRAYCYNEASEVLAARDPDYSPDESGFRPDYLLPHEIMLTEGGRYGISIVLNTKENIIRVIDWDYGPDSFNPPNTHLEYPNDLLHYRNYFARHAPSFLQRHVDRIKSLEVVPCGAGSYAKELYQSEFDPYVQRKMKQILTETYGWPDSFQSTNWQRDMGDIWNRVIGEWLNQLDD